VGISQAQASRKKSMHFEAADTTNSSLPNEYAVNLVESMPRKCQAIINTGGD